MEHDQSLGERIEYKHQNGKCTVLLICESCDTMGMEQQQLESMHKPKKYSIHAQFPEFQLGAPVILYILALRKTSASWQNVGKISSSISLGFHILIL